MSLAQRFERRLEGVVGSAFARVFKGQVEPVEIGNALQREASDKHAVMANGQILAPNRYRISLGTSDFERLSPWEAQLCISLAELVQEYLDEQDWGTVGDIEVLLHHDPSLHTGVFGVASRMEPEAPPRRRPYDSLSLPVVPGMPPGYYEHPFGSAPPAPAPAQQGGYFPPAEPYAANQPAYPPPANPPYADPNGAAPYAADPYAADPYAADPYAADPYSADPYGDPHSARQPAPATAYAPPPAAAPPLPVPPVVPNPPPMPYPGTPGFPGAGAPEYSHDPYAANQPQYASPAAPYGAPQPVYDPYQQPPARPQIRGVLVIDGSQTHIVLRTGSNVIGRSHDSDLQILDQGVSRRHVDVQFDGESAVAYDLGSTNGTSVNGHQIGSHHLQHGDVLRVGHTRIVYHQDHG